MSKILYVRKKFRPDSLARIEQANVIIEEYEAQGFSLTLRQLYYQFVARGYLENTERAYKGLGTLISDGRLAGLIDWDAIEDRTRNLQLLSRWENPAHAMTSIIDQYHIDWWHDQPYRVEVWIEKEALAGVFEQVCNEWDVPFFCCRGYTSQSEMWRAAVRLDSYPNQQPVILHFGDHDPSGIDMTRDTVDRLRMFMDKPLQLDRLALNMDQVRQYDPPPNPAKVTDSRFARYVEVYGDESWELDALEPQVLANLVEQAVAGYVDSDRLDETQKSESQHRDLLRKAQGSLRKQDKEHPS